MEANGNSDSGDVFTFRKPAYGDRTTYARMPVERNEMFYNMKHDNRGQAIIFNHENFSVEKLRPRSGTDVDARNLQAILEAYGFDVTLYHDLNYRELRRIIDKDIGTGSYDTGDVFPFGKSTSDVRVPIARMPVGRNEMFYNMKHKNRGHAIIFNHEHYKCAFPRRTGTEVDCKNIAAVLKSYGFEVQVHSDLDYHQLYKVVDKAAHADHTNNDCFVMVVLTHGEMGVLYARDAAYKPESLWTPFSGSLCPSLAGKPKMFFIQACQGDLLDGGVSLSRTETDGAQSYKIPNYADFLIAYSTIPGYYSWRNTTKGSWFIQALCAELEERGEILDLLALLTMVSQRVALDFESNTPTDRNMHQQKQIPCITSMLIRLVRLEKKENKK